VNQDSWSLGCVSKTLKNDKEVVLVAVRHSFFFLNYASDALRNDPCFVLSMKMIDIRRRFRWERLVKEVLRFNMEDGAFLAKFHPALIEEQAEEICNGGDEVGPQPTPFWTRVMNKRRQIA
jgi:hypothetical protein